MAERSAKQLGLSKADLPNSIIEVIATLTKSGFEAFIVGGGVRDTLLGLNPKDFDAVTDAKPHEIKDLFGKRCRIIGRRFQLAHVYSGRDMIEVATFRAPPTGSENTTSDGMIVRDNVWGDIHQDFERRDFSINAMYYEPLKGVVYDYCNAYDDIQSKTLRLLGHAPTRIEEDPVRLLRALRFKAKLGFEFDSALAEQFKDENWGLLDQVSPHRLYDESQKMFTGGYLVPLLPLLFEYGAIEHLIIYPPKQPTALVSQVAINTDKRIAMGKSINPAFFYAALLWDNYLYQLTKFKKKNMPFHDAQMQAASKVIDRQRIKTAIPKFAEQFIRDIWLMQPKLANPRVKQIAQLAEHSRFRAAFDFLLLREQCNDEANPLSESTNGMGEWWQTYQTLSEKQKQKAMDDFASDTRRGSNKSSRNRSRARNQNRDVEQQLSNDDMSLTEPHQNDAIDNKQPRNKRATKKHSKTSHDTTRDKLYSQERAQLQKLSLGKVAGEQAKLSHQPSPLFTINADKLAKQVPKQLEVDAQSAIKSASSKPAQQSHGRLQKNATDKDNNPTKELADSHLEAENVQRYKNGSVPSKRRRRLPSQTLTQIERARVRADNTDGSTETATNNAVDKTTKSVTERVIKSSPTNKPKATAEAQIDSKAKVVLATSTSKSSSKATLKGSNQTYPSQQSEVVVAKSVDSMNKEQLISKDMIPKNERVPQTRRRRQPSSTQTVKERLSS